MPVITISRQFGAAGVPVGRALAKRFGAEFLDRAIVAQVAIRSGIPETELETYDERLPSFWQRIAAALTTSSPEVAMPVTPYADGLTQVSTHDRLVAVTRSVIEEAAERGNAIIVGRGGAFILADRPDTLHVQLHAALDARVRYLTTRVDEAPADVRPDERSLREMCLSVDAARAAFVRGTFGADWLDATNYHLSIDTGAMGVARTVELIARAAE